MLSKKGLGQVSYIEKTTFTAVVLWIANARALCYLHDNIRADKPVGQILRSQGMKSIFLIAGLLWASPPLPAQYTIKQWNVEDGLPQSSVRCVTQTHDGYLWVGTWNGLARFDGVVMTAFNPRTRRACHAESL